MLQGLLDFVKAESVCLVLVKKLKAAAAREESRHRRAGVGDDGELQPL
jgi:hypothetical protein